MMRSIIIRTLVVVSLLAIPAAAFAQFGHPGAWTGQGMQGVGGRVGDGMRCHRGSLRGRGLGRLYL